MKNQILVLFYAALSFCFSMPASAAPAQPFLDPIRTELNKQLALAPVLTAADRKLVAKIKAALKVIDRPGTTNLGTDIKSLNLLTASLSRTVLADTFTPLLDAALDQYAALLVSNSLTLDARLDKLAESVFTTNARKNHDQLLALLGLVESNEDLFAAIKALGKAAAKFKVTDTLTFKAEHPPLGPDSMTAVINGAAFNAKAPLVNAGYNPAAHLLVLAGSTFSGTSVASLTLTIGNLTEGTSVHSFVEDSHDAIAAYTKGGLSGAVSGVVAKSGTITITHDPARKVVSGTFSFVGSDENNRNVTTVTNGKFVLRYLQ